MKFKIHLTEVTNFFFFLANLNKWQPWCREEYNKIWIKLTGKLTSEEKEILKKFRLVLKRTSKKEPLLYGLFFQSNGKLIWSSLKKKLSSQDYNIVKKTFTTFRKRFDKIWYFLRIKKIKKDFEQYINNFKYTNLILKDLANFYSKTPNRKLTRIFLILLPSQIKTGGGRYDSKNQSIILEGSSSRLMSSKTIEIFFHELIHLYFEKPYFEDLLNKYLKSRLVRHFIKEVIAGSLLPNGYLSQRYFKKPLSKIQSKNLPFIQKISLKLVPIVKNYLDHNKKIDKALIKKVMKLYNTRSE